jgi:S-adenosylmethionine synthetase
MDLDKGYLWTSEAVSRGHPDKVADQLADTVLDAHLAEDEASRVACEITCCKDLVLVTGEITSKAKPNIDKLIRDKLEEIGYDRDEHGFNCRTVEVMNRLNQQSPQIAAAVSQPDGQIGAGDQGLMFGFACNETVEYMPLAHRLSFEFVNALRHDIDRNRNGRNWDSPLLPDAKTQVTVEYAELTDEVIPMHVHTVVISTQHKPTFSLEQIQDYVKKVVEPVVEKYNRVGTAAQYDKRRKLFDKETRWLINPAGPWSLGGPSADTGLSGRKIVVDNYGADCPIGGGSFSGKDPTKVDRSGAYAARWIAKNLVAAGVSSRVTVQVSYAIGMVQPISVRVQTAKLNNISLITKRHKLVEAASTLVDLSPKGIIDALHLRTRKGFRYQDTYGGHFGTSTLPWEQLDLAEKFKAFLK